MRFSWMTLRLNSGFISKKLNIAYNHHHPELKCGYYSKAFYLKKKANPQVFRSDFVSFLHIIEDSIISFIYKTPKKWKCLIY